MGNAIPIGFTNCTIYNKKMQIFNRDDSMFANQA